MRIHTLAMTWDIQCLQNDLASNFYLFRKCKMMFYVQFSLEEQVAVSDTRS